MKLYAVIFLPTAQRDLQVSYDWGVRVWGSAQAIKWVYELQAACETKLAIFPDRFPLAPENSEFDKDIRQITIGRYRILFMVSGRTVYIFHIQGAYTGINRPDDFFSLG